jgi:hypothetical protein
MTPYDELLSVSNYHYMLVKLMVLLLDVLLVMLLGEHVGKIAKYDIE